MDLGIKYFDPRVIKPNSVVLMIGRRGSGKSTVAEDFMSYHTQISEGVCVSPTDSMNRFWTKHIPPLFIHHSYSHDITEKFLGHQEAKWKKEVKRCNRKGVEPNCKDIEPAFVIYDDVTYDKSFLRNTMTRRLLMNG